MPRDQVFISYSHEDTKWREDLEKHLKPYFRAGSIKGWSDKQIVSGSKWLGEIKSALDQTNVAVLLVTPDFLNSDFIHENELGPLLKEAERGGVTILWVPIYASAYKKTPLKNYQAALEPSKPLANMSQARRDQAWVKICEEIEKAVNSTDAPQQLPHVEQLYSAAQPAPSRPISESAIESIIVPPAADTFSIGQSSLAEVGARVTAENQRLEAAGRPSYWLLGDNATPLGMSAERTGTFVANLKHALLFHERILLSDSLVVNTPNFRRAIQADPQLRDYLAAGCLVIARRKTGDRFLGLIELRENLDESNSRNPGFDSYPRSFLIDDDLKDLQSFASKVPYDPLATRDHYTNSIRSLTADPRFRGALGDDADIVCAAILQRIQEKGYLDQTYFGTYGPDTLAGILKEDVWRRTYTPIFEFQTAFYYSAIPMTVGANIVFSAEHEPQRRILRHIDADGAGGATRVDLSRGAKSLYESVLSNMSARKLEHLRETDEFKEFQKRLRQIERLTDINDVEPAAQDIYIALRAYHRRIDEELSVLRYFQQGTALLDQWKLRGILKGGEWLLKFGTEVASDLKVRATTVSGIAELLHPGAGAAFLLYYFAAGKSSLERKLDQLPKMLEISENRRKLASSSTERIEGHVEIAPRTFKDTIYNTTAPAS
jgi:hypothetical protein